MRHLDTLKCPALALVLTLVAGESLAAARVPLGDAHRKAITSTRVVSNFSQLQMGASIRSLFFGPGASGGAIAGMIEDYRAREARREAARLEDALEGYDPRPRMKAALEQELGKLALFQGAKVEIVHQGPLSADVAGKLVAAGGADAVLVVDFQYGLSLEAEHLVVGARATLLPTAAAADPALKKALGASARELPVTPLYQAVLMTSMPAPGLAEGLDRWLEARCAPARQAIEGGIVELARMLAWDLEQGGPAPGGWLGSYPVPREKKVTLPQFDEDFEAAPTLTQGDRVWYRSKKGELVSAGDTYDAVELAPFAPAIRSESTAAIAQIPPEADAAGRLTFGFASADRTLQGGAVGVTQYSERPEDVEFGRKKFADGVLSVSGQVGFRKGSSFAGLGPSWELQKDGAPIDARKFQSVTVRLGATTRALRVRLAGRAPADKENACTPVYVIEDVDEAVKEYTIPFSKFSPEGWCGAKRYDVKDVLPALTWIEVVSNRITTKPLSIWVGATTLNP